MGRPLAGFACVTLGLALTSIASLQAQNAGPRLTVPGSGTPIPSAPVGELERANPTLTPRGWVQQTPIEPPAPQLPPSAKAPAVAPASFVESAKNAMQGPQLPPANSSISPCLRLEVVGPDSIVLGHPLTCTLVLRNVGNVPAYQVQVEDVLSANVRYVNSEPVADQPGDKLVWNLGMIDVGAERRIQLRLDPTEEGDVRHAVSVHFAGQGKARTKVTRPRLNATVTCPETALMGEKVAFPIQIANQGSGPANRVVLRAKLPDGLEHPQGKFIEADLGSIGPNSNRMVTLNLKAIHPGPQTVEVMASADGGMESHNRAAVRVVQPSVELKQSGPKTCAHLREAHFTLDVINTGSAECTNVKAAASLPEGLEFLSASDVGRYDPATRTIVWKLGDISAGHVRQVNFTVRASMTGTCRSRSVVQADGGVQARAEAIVRVEGMPTLSLELVDLDDPVRVGQETNYEIRIVNSGSCSCTNLRLTAHVPEGLQILSAAGPAAYQIQGRQVSFEPLASLGMNSDALFRVRVKGVTPSEGRFSCELRCDQLSEPVRKDEPTRITP